MAQTNYTPISLYYSTTASAVPTAANLVPGELAINTNDGKLYYEDSSGVVQVLASKAGALGDVVGPAFATDNALARFDLTTGKLIQNSIGILTDAGILTGLTGLTSSGPITLSSLTSGRVTYAGASGLLSDSTGFTFDGTYVNIGTGLTSPNGLKFLANGGGLAASLNVNHSSGEIQNYANTNYFQTVYTNNTEKMRITTAGNVGIGVTNPTQTLQLGNATAVEFDSLIAGTRTSTLYTDNSQFIIETATNINMIFKTNATQRMVITGGGNVGLGTSSPSGKLQIDSTNVDPSATATGITLINSTSSQAINNGGSISLGGVYTGSSITQFGYILGAKANSTDGNYAGYLSFGTRPNGDVSQERMRIDSSGNLLVGTTSGSHRLRVLATATQSGGIYVTHVNSAEDVISCENSATSGNNVFIQFYTDATVSRGSISYNRAGGLVVYGTTSDYRAKDISGPVTDSGALIDSVPVYMGTMKGATQERPMFIAHETPAYAHMGEKDAVDADGNPVYQQMDASALIPVMWAEIQSLRQRIKTLENK
jgi:hypothetical protein